MAWRIPAPVERIPVEILSYIFVLSTLSSPSISSDSAEQEPTSLNVESVKAPLTFTAVNRHWRCVALDTPALWTSLCVTVGSLEAGSDKESSKDPILNTSHINSYLSLSRKYPLDILIDARDMDWDFCEPEIPNFHDYSNYTPPFSTKTMSAVMSLLLPHISRWRSIDVLTDTWAPMYMALNMLNQPLTTIGAPLLESMTLMRCNDFVSHSPQFQPRHMKYPLFLKQRAPSIHLTEVLPRLRNLTLRGVHVCWSSLSNLLSAQVSPSILMLELSSHSLDVRPSFDEFRAILTSCPLLQRLAINGSGFALDSKTKLAPAGTSDSILLPNLVELRLGYRSTLDGRKIMALFNAPNLRKLTLEDATHPGEFEEVDPSSIFRYISALDEGDRTRSQSHDLSSSQHVTHLLEERAAPSRRGSAPSPRTQRPNNSKPLRSRNESQPFPLLEMLYLKGVKVDTDILRICLSTLPHLKSLTLNDFPFPMNEIYALTSHAPASILHDTHSVPTFTNPFSGRVLSRQHSQPQPSTPCPKLEHLCVRGGHLSPTDIQVAATKLALERPHLRNLDIYLDATSELSIEDVLTQFRAHRTTVLSDPQIVEERTSSDVHIARVRMPTSPASTDPSDALEVIIFRPLPCVLQDEEEDDDTEAHDSPFDFGGEFNDPFFDSHFTIIGN